MPPQAGASKACLPCEAAVLAGNAHIGIDGKTGKVADVKAFKGCKAIKSTERISVVVMCCSCCALQRLEVQRSRPQVWGEPALQNIANMEHAWNTESKTKDEDSA